MSLLLGADLPSDESDSDFSDESGSVESPRSVRTKRTSTVETAVREAKIDRIFRETKAESFEAAKPTENFTLIGEFWELFNLPTGKPFKNTSLDHLNFQVNQISNSVESETIDFSK